MYDFISGYCLVKVYIGSNRFNSLLACFSIINLLTPVGLFDPLHAKAGLNTHPYVPESIGFPPFLLNF